MMNEVYDGIGQEIIKAYAKLYPDAPQPLWDSEPDYDEVLEDGEAGDWIEDEFEDESEEDTEIIDATIPKERMLSYEGWVEDDDDNNLMYFCRVYCDHKYNICAIGFNVD